jgi:hypothetical protein
MSYWKSFRLAVFAVVYLLGLPRHMLKCMPKNGAAAASST